MNKFNPDTNKKVKSAKEQVKNKKQELHILNTQLTELAHELVERKQEVKSARVDIALNEGSEEALAEAEQAYSEGQQKAEALRQDIDVMEEVVRRLERKYEEARAKVLSKLEGKAKEQHDALVSDMMEAFNAFSDKAETLHAFEDELPKEINFGSLGLTRKELHARREPKLPWIMDKARKRGFQVF